MTHSLTSVHLCLRMETYIETKWSRGESDCYIGLWGGNGIYHTMELSRWGGISQGTINYWKDSGVMQCRKRENQYGSEALAGSGLSLLVAGGMNQYTVLFPPKTFRHFWNSFSCTLPTVKLNSLSCITFWSWISCTDSSYLFKYKDKD